jgi:PAS domain S-box-containing protein
MKVFSKVTGAVAGFVLLSVAIWAAAKSEIGGSLFSTDFLAHQYCYLRQPGLIWTNAISDGLIWISYLGIAASLTVLLRKTQNLLLFRWIFVAFGLFIVACGFTHFFEMVTIWSPMYWMSTSVKVLTAAASLATAIAFAPLVPRAAGAIRLYHQAYAKSEEQRVETLSKLLDTQERMKLAAECAHIGTWERNWKTNEWDGDSRARALLGISGSQQLTWKDVVAHIHPEDRAQTHAVVNDALAVHGEYNAAFRLVGDDGEVRSVIARGKLFYDDKRRPLRVIGAAIDVTREQQSEEALIKSEKLAAAGRMAASIAHEINNPLATAIDLVYLVRNDDEVPQHIKGHLEMLEHELNRAAHITRSTLTFYRESPTPVQTNLAELAESVLTIQQGNIRRAGVTLAKDLRGSQPIQAFPGELRQVLTNLISNAVESMQGRDGKLAVRVHSAKDWRSGRDGYRILIADNGPGIPPSSRNRIFNPFYTTKGEKGTGLGLWISSQLVEKHGGSIRCRSRSESLDQRTGTVFSVWLPLAHEFRESIQTAA